MLTAEQLAFVRDRRRYKVSWEQICREMGLSNHRVRYAFDPGYRAKYHQYEEGRAGRNAERQETGLKIVPQSVLVERERAILAPRSLTAILCGDPPPGRSALDKRRIRLVVSNSL